jgi:valyl-tRNA synthetase
VNAFPAYDPAEAEPRLQAAWSAAGIYRFHPADPRPIFAIDTPPPTVSGAIHIGHVYSYVQAEALIRYKRMRGYNVFYPFGFDDNGLPTERFVERSRSIKARAVGRAAFIQACLETSVEVEARFEQFWQRLGMSVDWSQRYSTIDPNARRTAQWSFLDLHKRGLIYRAQTPNPWCAACGTAVAQAEIDDLERPTTFYTIAFTLAADERPTTDDRRPTTESRGSGISLQPSAFSLQPSALSPQPSALRIATTRPELLPACVALFAHPDDPRYAALIGHEAVVPLSERRVPIYADLAVDPAKGTGLVMCCTFGDATDMDWWRTHQLPLIALVTREGRLSAAGGAYTGLTLAEARTAILADLRAAGLLHAKQDTRQIVRVHERCTTPIEILDTPQWYVRLLDAKAELLAAGRTITWHPAYMQVRYEQWVEGLNADWCISRQRFFGVPFPAWHCAACGTTVLARMDQLPVDPLSAAPPEPCACGGELRPDEDVMDTWATSSLSPQIAGRMLSDPALFKRLFPMQLRPQAHDIIRTWAFYTIAKAHFHHGAIPWETVMVSGHALDPAGHKLSKSKVNATTDPDSLITRYGADAVRYWACRAALGSDQPVIEAAMRQGKRLVTKLWNAAKLIVPAHRSPSPSTADLPASALHNLRHLRNLRTLAPADRALLSRLNTLIVAVTGRWEAYDYAAALELTERFFWDAFCDDYLELIKGRHYDGTPNEQAAARSTAQTALRTLLHLFAPVLPHVTDAIDQLCFAAAGESIHTAAWPEPDSLLYDPDAEAAGAAINAIMRAVRRNKSAAGLSLATPLPFLRITATDPALRTALEQSAVDLRSVTRAERLEFAAAPDTASLELQPGLWLAFR